MAQVFTDAQIQEILSLMTQHFSIAQYIGARYVPIFGRKGEESIEWDNSAPYEPLTIVLYQGNSFTSRQYVPTGVDINNNEFWAETGNYNGQMEYLREIVESYKNEAEQIINNTMKKYGVGKKAVIYGDSTINDTTDGERTVNYIATETGIEFTNRAISGTSLYGNSQAFYERIMNAAASDFEGFDFIFIAYGTNDWQASHQIESYGTGTVSFKSRLKDCVDRINVLAPKIKIVFITPVYARRPMVGNSGRTITNINFIGATIENYVNAIVDFCYLNNISCVDLFHTFNVNESNYQEFMVTSETTQHPEYAGVFVHYKQRTKEIIGEIFANQYPYFTPMKYTKQHGSTILGMPYFIDKTKLGNPGQINNFYGTLNVWGADKIKVFNDINFIANSRGNYIETIPFMFTDEMTLSLFNGGGLSILIYIDNVLYCELCYTACCAIYIKGMAGMHSIKIENNSDNSSALNEVNVQMFNGITDFAFEKCANGSGLGWQGLTQAEYQDTFTNSNLFFVCANANEINIYANGATLLRNVAAVNKIVDLPSFVADQQYYFMGGIYRTGTGWMSMPFFVGYNSDRKSAYLACYEPLNEGDRIYLNVNHENVEGCVTYHMN